MTIESRPNGNAPNTSIKVKATLTGNHSTNGRPEYALTRMSDSSTLVASSYSPFIDACRALRAAGESKQAYVDVLLARVDGVYVPTYSDHIGHGMVYMGVNGGV